MTTSCGLTLQICLIIALSFCCRRWRFGFVNGQVSLAWSIALRTQELYTRPCVLKERWLEERTGSSFLNFCKWEGDGGRYTLFLLSFCLCIFLSICLQSCVFCFTLLGGSNKSCFLFYYFFFFFFLYFSEKIRLAFHLNHLPCKQFTMKCQDLFSLKSKKRIRMMTATIFLNVFRVKIQFSSKMQIPITGVVGK